MSASKRGLLNLGNSIVHANPRSHNNYVACFSSISKGGATLGKLSERDTTVEGSEDGYGGSGISSTNKAMEGFQGLGHGGSGGSNNGGEQWREDMDMGDAARDMAGSMAEMAKAGVVGAMETGLKLGEIAKQTVDGMWDAAKKTTESVRDSVADDSDNNDRRKQTSDKHVEDQTSEKHVEDLRRLAKGCDMKDH
ncbi:hypothetical protein Pfo_014103 [Paulownia fortunei]|nr:hypothetical protein Pfo_014103 [Paulownia fortunei]